MDEDDLYGDIDNATKDAEIRQLKEDLLAEKKRNQSLTEEMEQLRAQTIILNKDKSQLEVNIKSVFDTALREIKRKDRDIADLQAQLIRKQLGKSNG